MTTVVFLEMEECVRKDPLIAGITILSPSTRRDIAGPHSEIWNATLLGTYWHKITAKRTDPCSVKLSVRSHGTVPWSLAPGAPAIDWDMNFTIAVLQVKKGEVIVAGGMSGRHDGFPSYETYVQKSLIYSHDAKAEWQTPLSLFPPMEFEAKAGGFRLVEPGDLSCCDCKDLR